VFGPGVDEPIGQYEGSGTSNRRFLSADERGSIISLTDSSGGLIGINTYDEYGRPGATNIGRFQYTGQRWIARPGFTTTRLAPTRPTSASSCRLIQLGTGAAPTFTPMCSTTQ
jgi:hypothetical protein